MGRHLRALHSAAELLLTEGPRRTIREGRIYARKSAFRTAHSLLRYQNRGTPIFEPDWDLFIVLDACRLDAMNEVADEYSFIDSVGSFTSLGSHSKEWMRRNFVDRSPESMANTAHVTGNPFSEHLLTSDDWIALEEVWKSHWDRAAGTIHPQPITDRAISVARERSPSKMIVHYMQPHAPFVGLENSGRQQPESWDGLHLEKTAWDRVRDGDCDLETAWNAYLDNLRYVLDSVELLLENVDADRVVISADHGECIGEYGIYGHPDRIALDPLREVPWVRTSATDTGSYTPGTRAGDATTDSVSREEKLEALGYR